MTPAMDDLLAESALTFTPLSGKIDVEAVAQAIAGIGFSYRDEIEPSGFAIFSTKEGRDECQAARRADPESTFPYVLLVTARPDVVDVFPVASQADLRALSVRFIEWLMSTYECRIENEFGTDMSKPRPPKQDMPQGTQPAA